MEDVSQRRFHLTWRLPALVATLATAAMIAVGAAISLGPVDDAYITYRCAQNLAAGEGLVYNRGERVEATSNFLFAAALAGLVAAGADPATGSLGLNAVALWSIFFSVLALLAPGEAERARRWRVVAATGLVMCPSAVLYLWAGLETLFYTGLLTVSATLLLRRSSGRPAFVAAGILWALAASTRMEALAFFPLFVFWMALGPNPRSRRSIPHLLISFSLVFAPVLAIRYGYYGYVFPNTYYAKVDGANVDLLVRGGTYLFSFLAMYLSAPVAVAIGIARAIALPGDRARAIFLVGVVAIQGAVVVYVGGDYFPYARFMVPALPAVAVLLADAAVVTRRSAVGPVPFAFAGALTIALVAGISSTSRPGHFRFAVTQQLAATGRAQIGKLLKRDLPADAVLLVGAAGATPYYSEHRSYDMFGLTDPFLAHSELRTGAGFAGHEKFDTAEQVNRISPDVIVFVEWPVKKRGPVHRQGLVLGAARAFDRIASGNSLLDRYELMAVSSRAHIAVCGVKKSMVPRVGPSFRKIPKIRDIPSREVTVAGGERPR